MYDEIWEKLHKYNSVCAVLPCRSGKSYIMKEICDNAEKKHSNVLILTHRRLLLKQHSELIKNVRYETPFKEAHHLGEYSKPDLIIIDEAHISGAESYRKICDYYKCKKVLFTATAKRMDNKPLQCDYIINGISADELIEQGHVSDYDLYAPKLNIDLSKVSMNGADFNNEQLGETMCDRKIYGDIIKYYKELADGRQSIAYCVNIKHSKSICQLFNDNGIPACHMDASTSEAERERLMNDYRAGKYMILCNCNLISEGITLPECDCCLLLRPTQSETLYIQQACRCLTPRIGKRAIIIDYVGNVYTHGMPTEKREYSLTHNTKIRNASREPDVIVRECKNCLRVYKGNAPICPYCGNDNKKTQQQIKEDRDAELIQIKKIEKQKYNYEKSQCRTLEQLINFGKKHGMKYPYLWAKKIIEARRNKINGV